MSSRMGVKRGRESGSDSGEVEYEKLRNDRLRENQKRMEELGILGLSKSLSGAVRPVRPLPRPSPAIPRVVLPPCPARRSSRLSGSPAISYAENEGRGKSDREGKEKKAGRRASEAGTAGSQPEIYTEEHEKLLGSAKIEWQLFIDGYDGKGNRIYDPAGGKTCHQCRQKTMGYRTSCSSCQALRGQFCGDCLYMRYGENVMEANENENWECPPCRGICNCSFCRLKRGWTPTGSLYKRIKSLGYKSVAHYLVLTRRGINDDEADEKVVSSGGSMKVKETPKADEVKEPLAEGAPVPLMDIDHSVSTVKQEMATVGIVDKNAPLKLISAKVEVANLAAKLEIENTCETKSSPSLVTPELVTAELEKPFELKKVPEVQTTLLTAGFRSRRAVSSRSKAGRDKTVHVSNVAEIESANVEVATEEHKNCGGRLRKKPPSGKVFFHGSAPRTWPETKPESETPILVLDSDSDSSSDFDSRVVASIARRLQRRRVT
ncbi:hypothetical protein M758_8G004900 [Ceratodon purpureus]|uniref:Zinc-finger domain-containing protein n=1 Tax=Ceratodon purpureus TaxID=3225 RepID=A0A8T0H1X5_CERPU|nr:hypothetical protein KC19_8G005500 [Ceratodon purpureus]KAG0607138.1 hypothetical protein M758_8G004900 [Ceratodon purpureus]